MRQVINLEVNGEPREAWVRPNETLLQVLRDRFGLTGTKEGCDIGKCGACTVLVDGKAIHSCLTLAVTVDGSKVTTIEGLSDGQRLHPLQQAFIDHAAVQCGFCSPGMIMAARAFLAENPHSTEDEVKEAMASNICRCTGYSGIIEAIMAVVRSAH